MKRGEIIINRRRVTIVPVDGTVWLSDWQIAQLFEVFQVKVSSNIRSIPKSGVLRKEDIFYCHHYENGNCVDLYNLEMITALAFRIHSRNTDIFWKWLMKRACYGLSPLMAGLCNEKKINLN